MTPSSLCISAAHNKENAALADGVSNIVPHRVLERAKLVPANIASGCKMSSLCEEKVPVEKAFVVQPPRGFEPLGHKMTSLAPHHADGLQILYHVGLINTAANIFAVSSVRL